MRFRFVALSAMTFICVGWCALVAHIARTWLFHVNLRALHAVLTDHQADVVCNFVDELLRFSAAPALFVNLLWLVYAVALRFCGPGGGPPHQRRPIRKGISFAFSPFRAYLLLVMVMTVISTIWYGAMDLMSWVLIYDGHFAIFHNALTARQGVAICTTVTAILRCAVVPPVLANVVWLVTATGGRKRDRSDIGKIDDA